MNVFNIIVVCARLNFHSIEVGTAVIIPGRKDHIHHDKIRLTVMSPIQAESIRRIVRRVPYELNAIPFGASLHIPGHILNQVISRVRRWALGCCRRRRVSGLLLAAG